jgi:hypothetical protein
MSPEDREELILPITTVVMEFLDTTSYGIEYTLRTYESFFEKWFAPARDLAIGTVKFGKALLQMKFVTAFKLLVKGIIGGFKLWFKQTGRMKDYRERHSDKNKLRKIWELTLMRPLQK